MEPLDRRTLLLGALGLGALGPGTLAACSGSPSAPAASASTSSPPVPVEPVTPSTAAPSAVDTTPRWPLTGLPLQPGASVAHPAVAVKVPDNRPEHPQRGIDAADVVLVELDGYRDAAGWSGTRLVPVFHSRFPDAVGPVRSIRPVDVPILAPVGAVIGNTGATGWVLSYVAGFTDLVDGSHSYLASRGTGAYSIDRSRVRTYRGVTYYDRAVVCHPAVLGRLGTRFGAGPRQPYLPFAPSADSASTASGAPAGQVQVPWKQGHGYDMTYRFDPAAGHYLRSMPWGPHVLAGGVRVTTDNVLVVEAGQRYAKLLAGTGGDEPIHDVVDSGGVFLYAHGGRHVTGRWTKGAVAEPFRFTLADGSPLLVAPGRTFVELARTGADVLVS